MKLIICCSDKDWTVFIVDIFILKYYWYVAI